MHSINLQRQLHLIQLSFLNSPTISDRWNFRWTHWIPNNQQPVSGLRMEWSKGPLGRHGSYFHNLSYHWNCRRSSLLLDICPFVHCPFSWFARWWNCSMPPKTQVLMIDLGYSNSLPSNTILSEDCYGWPGSGCPLFKLDSPTVSPSCTSSNPKRVRKIRSDWTLLIPAPG